MPRLRDAHGKYILESMDTVKLQRNFFKLRKISCQEVTSQVLEVELEIQLFSWPSCGALFVFLQEGAADEQHQGLVFTFQMLFQCPALPVNPSRGSTPMEQFKIMIPTCLLQGLLQTFSWNV